LAVNEELILLYWVIGREILERQAQEGWGSLVIGRVGRDFPDVTGLSARNVKCRIFRKTMPPPDNPDQIVGRHH
jgi:hypothetical protein